MNAFDRRWRALLPYVLIVLLPFVVAIPLLTGLLNPDPVLSYARLAVAVKAPILHGLPTIDPNIAFTSHALGHRAAEMLLAGQLPWWNHFEGIGMPLAGEMQSAAFFPFTWLQLLPDGQLLEHIALQILAGLCTFALLRRLGLQIVAALAGAIVYEFNGVFAWLTNAISNPVPFLPMLLLGIETAIAAARDGKMRGYAAIAAAVALSLYAGFPEIAYLNALLAAAWSVVRLCGLSRRQAARALMPLGIGAIGGVVLAAPVLIPFLDFLAYSDIGTHASARPNDQHQPLIAALSVPFPYMFGTIFAPSAAGDFWGSIGGYAGALLTVLGLAGVRGETERPIRRLCAGWALGCLLVTFGLFPGRWFGAIIPGIRYVYLARYLPSSWIVCMTILASFAISDMAERPDRARLNGSFAAVAVVAAALMAFATPIFRPIPNLRTAIICASGLLLCLAALRRINSPRAGVRPHRLVAVLLTVESMLLFFVPTLSNPRAGVVDLAGVDYLKAHLGLDRFVTLGPIAPNYGTYFGLASINYNDLPTYGPWSAWVTAALDRNADPTTYDGVARRAPDGPSAASEIERNKAAYAAVGVRYVVTPPDVPMPGLAPVFRAPAMTIYALPDPAPYFDAPGCTIDAQDRDTLIAHCPAAARLVRREAWMPGWTVEADGRRMDVGRHGPLFQSIPLPSGETRIAFAYRPPHMIAGVLLAMLAAAVILILALKPWIGRWMVHAKDGAGVTIRAVVVIPAEAGIPILKGSEVMDPRLRGDDDLVIQSQWI